MFANIHSVQSKLGEFTKINVHELLEARTNKQKVDLVLSRYQMAVDDATVFKSYVQRFWSHEIKNMQLDVETVCRLRRLLIQKGTYKKSVVATIASKKQQEAMRRYYSHSLPLSKEVRHG